MSNKPTHYYATLVRGSTYYLGADNRFEARIPRIVTAAEKRKLETNAIDRRTIFTGEEKEIDTVCKFTFKPVTTPVAPKGNKVEEIAAMQSDGGVSFEEEVSEDEEELVDEDFDEEAQEGDGTDETFTQEQAEPKKPKGRNR